MSPHARHPGFRQTVMSVIGTAMVIAAVATTTSCSRSPEPAKHDSQSMASEPMDHSKMDMKNMSGMKHMDGMSMTGDADYDFAANMRMHHQMAVDMSEAVLKNGKNPQLLQMARDIITAQKKEIAVFDQWMAAHKKP